jgi:uncharacterized oxidoreductase
MQLTNNTIVITGGTSGIGLGFARRLAADNHVIVCGRRKDRLEDLRRTLRGVDTMACDVALAEDRERFHRWVIETHPDANVLINNAGVQLLADMTKPVDLSRVRLEIETNVVAPVHLASLFVPHLKTKPGAAIINVSSGLAMIPLAFMPVYCATKAAVHSLTMSLRYQLQATAVRVFEIAPPAVDTELGHDRRSDKSQTHGGMPVEEFLDEALAAVRSDVFEAPIGGAKGRWQNRQSEFEAMNARVMG